MKKHSSWGVARAKAQLSLLIDRALEEGPQVITRNGREVVVVVSFDEWERKRRRRGNLAEFFTRSPLQGSGVKIERPKDQLRDLTL